MAFGWRRNVVIRWTFVHVGAVARHVLQVQTFARRRRCTPTKTQIPLVTSRLDTTRHVRRVEPMHFGCRACRTARLDALVFTRSTRRTCRVVSRRDVTSQVEFWLNQKQRRSVDDTFTLRYIGKISVDDRIVIKKLKQTRRDGIEDILHEFLSESYVLWVEFDGFLRRDIILRGK